MGIKLSDISVNTIGDLSICCDGDVFRFQTHMEEESAKALSDFLKLPANSPERKEIHSRERLKDSISAILGEVNEWILKTGRAGCCNTSNKLHEVEQKLKVL